MSDCIQYYYENPEDAEKYNIKCENRVFSNLNDIEKFNNKDLLDYIDETYSKDAFPENSPFEFSDEYINLSNDEICKSSDMTLGPQQKFMGQLMGPKSNFNGVLIYHGLGSGKSCTSIVIGEALKNASFQRLLFAVPAPLVDQYFEEISGEIRNGKFFACPSFCLVRNGGRVERDYYVSQAQNSLLLSKMRNLDNEQRKLDELQERIDAGDNSPATTKAFNTQEVKLGLRKRELMNYQKEIRTKIVKTFEIVTHNTFIESIYKTGKDGQLIRNKRLLEDSALFHENGLLIIDEIQRLVSDNGTFYNKLYKAIKYFFHPNLKLAIMSATPVYDNPYELALTMNLLRPRIPFILEKEKFYSFLIGRLDSNGNCVPTSESGIFENSCPLDYAKDLIRYMCAGYVSYFKGGNPNAYPYKRVIQMEHVFSAAHKSEYISALRSDVIKAKQEENKRKGDLTTYENVLLGNFENDQEDNISGFFVNSQQYCNISLPRAGDGVNKTAADKKQALQMFRREILSRRLSIPDLLEVIKGYSVKFAKIIELTINSDGPVFIFSNWLTYGVEPLAIILEACGLVSFEKEDQGSGKFFIWSSETKTKDRDGVLVKKARNTFNSIENKDGSKLKVILGTRSVMEGVSFKNVKQVHITDSWWNESRIEQILARASRYCSHTNLPLEEQYVDIYRHFSSFGDTSQGGDPDVIAMLNEAINQSSFRDLENLSIDQKIKSVAEKKNQINIDINILLKECALDSKINKNGNLIRLEEHISPSKNGFVMYYKNPSNGNIYKRDGIPDEISFNDIYSRKYSYPNNADLPIRFTEIFINEDGNISEYSDARILTDSDITNDLITNENITPWYSDKKFADLEMPQNLRNYLLDLHGKHKMLPTVRKLFLNETGDKAIKFKPDIGKSVKLINCIKDLAKKDLVGKDTKKKIAKEFNRNFEKDAITRNVLDLVYKYKLYPESQINDLINIGISNPESIKEMLKEVSKK